MEMEIDLPKDAISKSQWLLNNAKKAENIPKIIPTEYFNSEFKINNMAIICSNFIL